MTIRHLKIFIAVYETLSFTKAGKKLYLAQPAISLAIKELETYYGIPLFDRIKHSIFPTQYGEQFYKYASQILSLLNEMNDFTKEWNTKATLRIGSSITIGNNILPLLVKQFKDIHPDIDVEIVINNSITIENLIMQNQLDFALIENKPALEKTTKIVFMQDYLCTIAHISHPLAYKKHVTLKRLSKEPFLMREKGSSVRELVESIFKAEQLQVKPQWESTSTQALIRAVENNLGITTLPYQLLNKRYDQSKIVMLDAPQLNVKRDYNIIYYQGKYLSKPIHDFINLCKKAGNLK